MTTTVSTFTPISENIHIRGLEMPWNRVLESATPPAGAARALGPWHPQEFQAECVEAVAEVGDMITLVFRRLDGAPLAFRSGQYLNIAFPIHGEGHDPVDRSYSLSSAPTVPWTFAVTVTREADGEVSPWVHENVRPGTILDMLGPVGAFHLPDADRRARYLFLAAGSGITPLMSMIRTIHSLPGSADVVVLYHGAEPGTFAFSRELEYIASVDWRIRVYYSLGDRSQPGNWEGMVGRLTTEMINEVAPDANGRQVYACGPEGYLTVAEDLLRQVGVDDASIHVEYFSGGKEALLEYDEEVALAGEIAEEIAEEISTGESYYVAPSDQVDVYGPDYDSGGLGEPIEQPEILEASDGVTVSATAEQASEPVAAAEEPGDAAPAAFDTVGEGTLTMTFLKTKINVRISPDERILPAAKEAGVRIGSNCMDGMCGSCKSVKVSGEVEMNHQGGIRAREIEAGKFLPCCSTALTDVVIDA
ncbi:MAG: flavin reductase family protein [Micrococcaceae bacterium]